MMTSRKPYTRPHVLKTAITLQAVTAATVAVSGGGSNNNTNTN